VLGTSSSETVLPHMLQKMEHLGASKSVVGLVVPTGYSFNLDGTNIYMTLATLFLAQATNTPLTFGHLLGILGVAMITSKGASGVTGAGFVTLAATLSIVPDIPVESIAIILGIDKFMSECRALTNLIGNGVGMNRPIRRLLLYRPAGSPARAGPAGRSAGTRSPARP
jgi:aerobic C4-dicarboxylate transport protein